MTTHDKIYIDGAWVPSSGSGSIDVYDSSNGEVIASIPAGTGYWIGCENPRLSRTMLPLASAR